MLLFFRFVNIPTFRSGPYHGDFRMIELGHIGHHVVVRKVNSLGWACSTGRVGQNYGIVVNIKGAEILLYLYKSSELNMTPPGHSQKRAIIFKRNDVLIARILLCRPPR